jgi:hypothetical protein
MILSPAFEEPSCRPNLGGCAVVPGTYKKPPTAE